MNLDCPFPYLGFPGGSEVKNPPANAGDAGDSSSIPGLGISLGKGNGNLFQYSCLENMVKKICFPNFIYHYYYCCRELNGKDLP